MRTKRRSSARTVPLGMATLAALTVSACAPTPDPADLVLLGGSVVTLSEAGVAEGIAIRGDRIVAVGSSSEVRAYVGPETRVVELDGRSVIPGLADNHFHGIGGGPGVDLSRTRSIADVVEAVAARAAEIRAGEVIRTNSDWHEGQLAEQTLPYRDDLDRATSDHAVVVVRGGHEYILNSAALARWSIDESTPAVSGGRIGRYEDGRLNGELVDRAKNFVVLPPVPERSEADMLAALAESHRTLNSRGLTSIRYPGSSPLQYSALQQLKETERLNIRVEFLLRAPRSPQSLAQIMNEWPAPGAGDAWLKIGGVKLGVDGGFEGGLMREPYEEPWGEGGAFSGLQTVPREPFVETVRALHASGWRVATHAVGDAAIDLVLDAYEVANADAPLQGLRWVIEHGFIPRDDQFPRMRALGLSVSARTTSTSRRRASLNTGVRIAPHGRRRFARTSTPTFRSPWVRTRRSFLTTPGGCYTTSPRARPSARVYSVPTSESRAWRRSGLPRRGMPTSPSRRTSGVASRLGSWPISR